MALQCVALSAADLNQTIAISLASIQSALFFEVMHNLPYMCGRGRRPMDASDSMMFFGNCDCCRSIGSVLSGCVRAAATAAAHRMREKWPFVVDGKRFATKSDVHFWGAQQ